MHYEFKYSGSKDICDFHYAMLPSGLNFIFKVLVILLFILFVSSDRPLSKAITPPISPAPLHKSVLVAFCTGDLKYGTEGFSHCGLPYKGACYKKGCSMEIKWVFLNAVSLLFAFSLVAIWCQ